MTAIQPFPHARKLDEEHRRRLLERYARLRRADDLERLVVSYRPLACSLARRYHVGSHVDPDLEQAAYEGLVKAIRRFEPDRGTPFTTFAVPTILGEVRRYLRDTVWPAHVPRKVQERVRAVRRTAEAFGATHGRSPSVAELAAALDCGHEEIVEALAAVSSTRTVSFDAQATGREEYPLADRLGGVDPAYDRVECLTAIDHAFPRLPIDEQTVVQLHFGAELTQRQIASRLGYSRSHVGRLLGSALDHLRETAAA
jgi:RNA polymerase sigma-B factor